MKIDDRIPRPPTGKWDDPVSEFMDEVRSRGERSHESVREAARARRATGVPRTNLYRGVLRDLGDTASDIVDDWVAEGRRSLQEGMAHPDARVRSEYARRYAEFVREREAVGKTLHPSKGRIRDAVVHRRNSLEGMAKSQGITMEQAAEKWLRTHGASKKMAMEQAGFSSQTPMLKLRTTVRGALRYDLPKKAVAARRFLKGVATAMATVDPWEFVSPITVESARGSYPASAGVKKAKVDGVL